MNVWTPKKAVPAALVRDWNQTETACPSNQCIHDVLQEQTTVRRMGSHLEVLLRAFLQHPQHRISELPMLTTSERHQLIERNRTEMEFARDKCVHELFEQQVRETPNAEAVTFRNLTWTYRELNSRANAVARRLREAGVCPGTLVGVYVERSAEIVAVLLGIWKAACAYVPLDHCYPAERIKDISGDARLTVMVTNKTFASNIYRSNVRLLFVEEIFNTNDAQPNWRPLFYPEDLAYVMYTSDCAGKPKGVQIRHRSVTNLLAAIAKTTSFSREDHVAAVTTIAFDISIVDLFLPLTTGAKITVVEQNVANDGIKLAKLVDQANVSVLQATPATWRMLVESGWRGNPRLKILCGGEMLTDHLAKELQARAKMVWKLYGATEITVYCTGSKVESGKRITIGQPLGNMQAYILDKHLQPVPVGVAGELHIGGEGLAVGYLNQPELTAEKFIPNPLDDQSVIYKTGDLARYLSDGNIECLGRVDHSLNLAATTRES